MSNNVYVLGAGASKDAGLPLVNDFNDKEYLSNNINIENDLGQERYNNALHFLDLLEQHDIPNNIEEALTNLVCSKFLKVEVGTGYVQIGYPEHHKANLEWLIAKCVSIEKKDIPSFYFDFFKKVGNEKSTIITFNYDIIPELCFEKLGIDYDLGFFGYDYQFKKEKKLSRDKPILLKLHGSIDWLYCEDCGINVYGEKDYFDYRSNRNLVLDYYEGKGKCPQCHRKNRYEDNKNKSFTSKEANFLPSKIKPVIIPPLTNKNFNQQYRGKRDIRELWLTAKNELMYSDEIYFIGYSLPEIDIFARNLFSISQLCFESKDNIDNKKYYIVDPSPAKQKFDKLLQKQKIRYICKTFQEYI